MGFLTIQAAPAGNRPLRARGIGRGRPLALIGAALALLEFAIAAAGGRFPLLAGLVLVLSPGLALVPVLPARARESWAATVAAVPVLGFAASWFVQNVPLRTTNGKPAQNSQQAAEELAV